MAENTNLVDGLNELIEKLETLAFSADTGTPDSFAEAIFEIADNLDTIRVAYETQSTAAIVAQNTNFNDLTTALAMLKLVCCTKPQVTAPTYFAPGNDPSSPMVEFDPPPSPFIEIAEDVPGFYASRKCYVANRITDEVKATFQYWDDLFFDEFTSIVFVELVSLYVTAVAILSGLAPFLAFIMAHSSGIIERIVDSAIDNQASLEYGDIVIAIENNRDDLVCALYEAGGYVAAKADFIDVLDVAGLTQPNQIMVASLLEPSILNHLFAEYDQQIEVDFLLEGGDSNCDDCLGTCDTIVSTGTIIDETSTHLEIQSGMNGPAHFVGVALWHDENGLPCGKTFTVSNVNVTNGTIINGNPSYRFYFVTPTSGSSGDRYNSNNIPTSPVTACRWLVIQSQQAFTVEFDFDEEI